ncbi:MAG: NAD(P)/FAD-dependent oxidoreductase [Bacillota bacterium]
MAMKVIVVGGGAAGMMAAGRAAELGAEVRVLEKMNQPGKKLLITGKGRCNITNYGERDKLIKSMPGNGSFLFSAFSAFSNYDLISFLQERGVETKVERGERVFPVSDDAEDVARVFRAYAEQRGSRIITNAPVAEILCEHGHVTGIKTAGGKIFPADKIILATGGASYPGTGSTGDGYTMAEKLGHTIQPLRPALVPLETGEAWVRELQGLTLKNVAATAYCGAQVLDKDFGELLFTHFGVSGPIILSLSGKIAAALAKDNSQTVQIRINLKPALSEEQLYARLQRDFTEFARKQFKNALHKLLPQKLIPVVVGLSGISGDKEVHQITREERRRIVQLLLDLRLTVTKSRPLAEAIVTAGGVSVREINPKTMESKIIGGLYFAGEVIDIDGYTGGFNLQAAFSTGYAAGTHAARG